MLSRLQLRAVAVAALTSSVALTGCSGDNVSSGATPSGSGVFATAYRDAAEFGASEAQLNALAAADSTGDMSYETLVALIDDTFACLEEAGIPYVPVFPEEIVPGFAIPSYATGESSTLGEQGSMSVVEGCQSQFSMFAERAFQWQPRAQALRDEALIAELPQVLQCLRENGASVDEGSPLDEIRAAVDTIAYETSLVGPVVVCWIY